MHTENTVKYKYITIQPSDEIFDGKPQYEVINNKEKTLIGLLFYYKAWKQYCFTSGENCVFNSYCLNDIIDYLDKLNNKRKPYVSKRVPECDSCKLRDEMINRIKKQKERLSAHYIYHECLECFHKARNTIAGQAFTSYTCEECGTEAMHPNTNKPVVCDECAKRLVICKRCKTSLIK
jgi:ribosomal protein S27E